jgi:predicted RNase H-like HicB family nuclease
VHGFDKPTVSPFLVSIARLPDVADTGKTLGETHHEPYKSLILNSYEPLIEGDTVSAPRCWVDAYGFDKPTEAPFLLSIARLPGVSDVGKTLVETHHVQHKPLQVNIGEPLIATVLQYLNVSLFFNIHPI